MEALNKAVADIFAVARELFKEFFAALTDDEISKLEAALARTIKQAGRSLWKMDAEAIKTSFLRNWNGIAFMILAKLKAEEKHNAERALAFAGKSLAVLISVLPALLTMGGDDTE